MNRFNRPAVFREGMPGKARAGDGFLAMPKRTNNATDANFTIPVSTIVTGIYSRSGTNTSRTDTFDTAANIAAALEGMDIGDTYLMALVNLTGTNAITLGAGAGNTLAGFTTVPANTTRWALFEKTAAEAFTIFIF